MAYKKKCNKRVRKRCTQLVLIGSRKYVFKTKPIEKMEMWKKVEQYCGEINPTRMESKLRFDCRFSKHDV